jgi:hypothetical protein
MYVVQTFGFWFINNKTNGNMLKLGFFSSKQQFYEYGYFTIMSCNWVPHGWKIILACTHYMDAK